MRTLIKIAWRNVMRNKRRTVLSALVISVGLSIYILMNSIMAGMDRANIDNLIELSTSSIKISTEQYAEDKNHFLSNMAFHLLISFLHTSKSSSM